MTSELTAILDQLPSGVVVADKHGQPKYMNAAARGLFDRWGKPIRSLLDISAEFGMRDAATGRTVQRDATPAARALRGEAVSGEEYIIGQAQDPRKVMRLRISGIPRRGESGEVIGAISVFTDVTVEEALQGSEQRLLLALEAGHMGTWDYDVARDRVEWTREMAAILGAPTDKLGGPLRDAFTYVHPEDAPGVERAVCDALERGRSLRIEARTNPRNGARVRWVMVRGRVYRDEDARPLRMTGIAMDITDRKEAEAAREALAHSERLRALGQMASGVAHDLNQSLALITGYCDMTRQELTLDIPDVARVREMVEIAARAAIEGGQAVKGLLSFVRTQELMTDIERFDVAKVLQHAARLTAPRWRDASQAEGRPINLRIDAVPGLIIRGSPGALREAITNLIFNAVDATPLGGDIRLRARRAGDAVIVEISDTGTGIPPDVQARIFDPFFTTKGERGTGLGLPQVAAIVERHDGTIELDSAPGRGTTFRLKFPAAEAPQGTAVEAAEHAPANAHPARSVSILVVEDEVQLARMAGMVLTQRGHHVVVAESVEQALQHLEHEPFELIISDLGLGAGKNGWDLAEEVRARWPGVRFVLVTGWGAAIDPKDAQARGVHEVIAKPYRIADLRQIADRIASTPPD